MWDSLLWDTLLSGNLSVNIISDNQITLKMC